MNSWNLPWQANRIRGLCTNQIYWQVSMAPQKSQGCACFMFLSNVFFSKISKVKSRWRKSLYLPVSEFCPRWSWPAGQWAAEGSIESFQNSQNPRPNNILQGGVHCHLKRVFFKIHSYVQTYLVTQGTISHEKDLFWKRSFALSWHFLQFIGFFGSAKNCSEYLKMWLSFWVSS